MEDVWSCTRPWVSAAILPGDRSTALFKGQTTALSEIAMLSAEIRYQCTLVTLDEELLERSYSHRSKTHLAARSRAVICNQPQEQKGRVKEGNGMLKHLAAYYEVFYM